jgi:hypothetical protein
MSLIVDINPVPWKILDLVKARILKNRAKKAKKGMDWSKETLRREMALSPAPLISRRRDEPSFVAGGSIHYSITILPTNTEYLRGTVTGFFVAESGQGFTGTFYWISKSQPVLTPFGNPQLNFGDQHGNIPCTLVSLVDSAAEVGIIDGWAGYFNVGTGPTSGLPSDGRGGLVLGNPVVTTTGTYSELLNRDWENWSNKTLFEYESINDLGAISNSGGKDNKRFILLVPRLRSSAGIQVYPTQWPRLADGTGETIGYTIEVATLPEAESVVTGPSDYFNLIESATGISWNKVESVCIVGGGAGVFSNSLSAFMQKLTEFNVPFSTSYNGNIFGDEVSWVYPHVRTIT